MVGLAVGHGADGWRVARTLPARRVVVARAACFTVAAAVIEPVDGLFPVPAGAVLRLADGVGDGFEVCDGPELGVGDGPLLCDGGAVGPGDDGGALVIVRPGLGLAGEQVFEFGPLDDPVGEVEVLDPDLVADWPGPVLAPLPGCGPLECSDDWATVTAGEMTCGTSMAM